MPPTTSPRTVLHLVWELDDGGLELMLTSLLGTLQRQRYEPFLVVFGPEGDLSEAVSRLGVPVHHLNVQRGSELRRACETLARMIRHIGPDQLPVRTRAEGTEKPFYQKRLRRPPHPAHPSCGGPHEAASR
jgi:hypothetical protein